MSGTNNLGKMPILIVALVIGIIMTTTAIVPLVSDYSDAKTFQNNGAFKLAKFTPTDEYTIVFDNTGGEGIWTVGDTVVTPIPGVSLTNYGSYSVLASDNVLLRYGSNNSGYYCQIVGNDSGGNNVLAGSNSITATITGGNISITYVSGENTLTKTFTFTEMYAIVPEDYTGVMKSSASQVYIKGDSELYASGLTTVTQWNNMFHFEGTYDDGITISSPNLTGATFDNIEWNITPVSGYVDLYELTSIEFDIIYNDATTHATYSYFVVPSEVSADTDNPDSYKALVKVIPVMAFVALIAAAAFMIYSKRD